jgi:hypothetical protein
MLPDADAKTTKARQVARNICHALNSRICVERFLNNYGTQYRSPTLNTKTQDIFDTRKVRFVKLLQWSNGRPPPVLGSVSSMKTPFTFPKIRRRNGDQVDAEDRIREVQIRNRAVLPRAIPASTVIVRFDLSAKQQYMFGTRPHLLVPHSMPVPQHTFVCDCV